MFESRIIFEDSEVQTTNPTTVPEKTIPAVPDNCFNCPESSCCPYASDKWHGKAGYDD